MSEADLSLAGTFRAPGEFAGTMYDELREELKRILQENQQTMVVDFEGVKSLDVGGLVLLAQCSNSLQSAGRTASVVNCHPGWDELLSVSGLNQTLVVQ